ncbi:MAG: hypothetical protein ACE5JS_16745, partial [Nitrospinota bacterium]
MNLRPKHRTPFRSPFYSSLFSLACVLGLALAGGYLATQWEQSHTAELQSKRIAEHVRLVTQKLFSESVWTEPSSQESAAVFEKLARSKMLRHIEKVRKVKVWDAAGRIVWSDDTRLIGRRSAEEGLKRALAGTVHYVFELPEHDDPERQSTGSFASMEVHVPVWRKGGGGGRRPDLVIETYTDATEFLAHLKTIWSRIWTVIGLTGLLFYLVMLRALRRQRLYHESVGVVGRLSVLQDLSRQISSTLEPEGVFTAVVQGAVELLGGDRSRLFLLSPDGKT